MIKILILIAAMCTGCVVRVIKTCDGNPNFCEYNKRAEEKPKTRQEIKPKSKFRRPLRRYKKLPGRLRMPPHTPKKKLPKTEDEKDLEEQIKKDKKKKRKKRFKKKKVIIAGG